MNRSKAQEIVIKAVADVHRVEPSTVTEDTKFGPDHRRILGKIARASGMSEEIHSRDDYSNMTVGRMISVLEILG